MPDPAVALCAGTLRRDLGVPVLAIVARPERARELHSDLQVWCGEDGEVYQFPEGETLPFERLMADEASTHGRIRALEALAGPGQGSSLPPIVVASVAAAGQRTMQRDIYESTRHRVAVGQRIDLNSLMKRWQSMGYKVERSVEIPGTVSRRGGILDVFSPGSELPARIELLGDEVESIRLFDPASQRSLESVAEALILPCQEALPHVVAREEVEERYSRLDISNCPSPTRDRIQEEMSLLLSGHTLEEPGFYQGFFCLGSILDFLPGNALVLVERPGYVEEEGTRLDDKSIELRDAKEQRGDVPRNFPSLHIPWEELNGRLSAASRRLDTTPWASFKPEGDSPVHDLGFIPTERYNGRLDVLAGEVQEWRQRADMVVLVTNHASRLAEVFKGLSVPADPYEAFRGEIGEGVVALVRESLAEGWSLPIGDSTLHVLTDSEIMGQAKERPVRRRSQAQRAPSLAELETGSYLVHTEHGIGRFVGTRHMGGEGAEKEYLVLEYAAGDTLYVPTDQLDRVAPYVASGERMPSLTRLGTQEWRRAKDRARASTRELAEQLLSLYASREIVDGFAFSADTPWQQEMEDAFPYQETPDQMESIVEVKRDMEDHRPMDRLVCGDVGYGKTEVALRAAFKAVMDGAQVAFLVPTTVLAQQHYVTFTERLATFPLRVEVLSRFRTNEEQRRVVEDLAEGKVDICIGTHRLLQKDVSFKNLGLVVVDEEQRFGVAHKERLKEMRSEADVLTLSATPIPRTLHMALSGIRDMSTIETPPEERLSIKTYISEFSEEVIREAILREMDRGGQAFFLHNRVHSIEETSLKIREIVPEAAITIGHGQMPEETLERVMAEFGQGKFDVMVCTTIIEAGLDMPNVNTLIIDRADRLGLAQLYQLRGRIGRGVNRAYAYLMVPRRRRITETAEKRLKTIMAATELGAGFRIAMRDLEIRGAGNILGAEQSGHIHSVGYELYSQMLAQAVDEVRSQRDGTLPQRQPETQDTKVDLPIAAHIPAHYITDFATRLGVYQRMVRTRERDDIVSLSEEIRDRFGPLPKAVRNLLYVIEIKALARQAGAESISQDGKVAVVQLREPVEGARLVLQKALGRNVQVGHSQIRLPLVRGWQDTLSETLERLASFMNEALELTGAVSGRT